MKLATDNDNLQEMLDRYLLGRLSPEEEEEFNSRLLSDAALRDEAAMMKRILDTLSAHASRREAMLEWDKEEMAPKTERPSIGARLRPVLSAAASIALLCTLGLYLYSPSAEDTATPSTTDIPAVRGSAGGESVSDIVSSLNQGRKMALETLDKIDTVLKDSLPDSGLRAEEEAYQREIISERLYELKWLRINTMISLGRISEVKDELKAYSSQPGPNREKAQELLSQIEQ